MGLLTGTRILGLLYFALGAGWIVYLLLSCKQRAGLWPSLIYFTAGWSLALYASWPFLWTSPIGHFAEAFANMSRFRWDLDVLFDGEYINATKVPWFYIPVWFAITSPLLFLVAGAAGIMIVCVRLFKHGRFAAFETQTDLFILLGFLLPLVIVAVLRSVIYDSWRHLYFIYVPFVLLSAAALRQLHTKTGLKTTFVLSSLLVAPTIIFHVAAHPFQYVYFSPIVTSGSQEVRHRFEMDYWGVSYKQALEHVLSIDESQLIKIAAQNEPCERNVEFLPAHLRERFVFVPITEAEYFFTNYRWHPHEYDDLPVKTELIKSFSVQGNAFQSVYRVVK